MTKRTHVARIARGIAAGVVAIPTLKATIDSSLIAAGASGAVIAGVDVGWIILSDRFKARKAAPAPVQAAKS